MAAAVLAGCTTAATSQDAAPEVAPGPTRAAVAPSETGTRPAPTPDDGGLTLLDPGREPRRELRYDIEDGQTFSTRTSQSQEATQSVDGESMGTSEMTFVFDVAGDVASGGDTFTARSEITDSRVRVDGGPAVPALDQALEELAGLAFIETLDVQGRAIDRSFEDPDLAAAAMDPTVAASIDSLLSELGQTEALPTDPVGLGARWEITEEIESGGIALSQTRQYELLFMEGSVIELAIHMEQVPLDAGQPIDLPDGTQMIIEDAAFTGVGSTVIDLTQAAPVASDASTWGSQTIRIEAGEGQSGTLRTDVEQTVKVRPN